MGGGGGGGSEVGGAGSGCGLGCDRDMGRFEMEEKGVKKDCCRYPTFLHSAAVLDQTSRSASVSPSISPSVSPHRKRSGVIMGAALLTDIRNGTNCSCRNDLRVSVKDNNNNSDKLKRQLIRGESD